MLAFKDYHSLIEMKRYMIRFIMYLPDIDHFAGIFFRLVLSVFQKFEKYISHRLIKRDDQRFSVFRHIDSYRIHIKNDILYLYMNEASLPDTCAEQKIGDHPALVFHVFTRLNIRFFSKVA